MFSIVPLPKQVTWPSLDSKSREIDSISWEWELQSFPMHTRTCEQIENHYWRVCHRGCWHRSTPVVPQEIKGVLSPPSLIWPFWYLLGVGGMGWQGSPGKCSLSESISKCFFFLSSGLFSDFIFSYTFWLFSIIGNLENRENRGKYKEEIAHDSATQKQPLLTFWYISF